MKRFISTFYLITACTASNTANYVAHSIALDGTDQPVIAGSFRNPQNTEKLFARRYTTGGQIDTSFGTDGEFQLDPFAYQNAASIVIDADENIYIVGTTANDSNGGGLALKLLPSGALDMTFGVSGVLFVLNGNLTTFRAQASTASGIIYAAAGTSNQLKQYVSINTYNSSGISGVSYLAALGAPLAFNDCVTTNDAFGTVALAGLASGEETTRGLVAQYLVSFTGIGLDPSFGGGEIVYTSGPSSYARICKDPDGNLVVIGQRLNGQQFPTQVIERYTATGAIDTSFGVSGSFAVPADLNAVLATLACQDDGNIVAGGYNTTQGTPELIVLRALSGGQGLDTSFGNQSGAFVLLNEDVSSQANDLVLNASGCIYVAGSYDNDVLVLKLGPDGIPMIDFGNDGAAAALLGIDVSVTVLRDQKSSGTPGGAFGSSTVTRVLNTLVGNSADVSLNVGLNRFTIQPGSYLILASAPGGGIGNHKISLFDVTHSSTIAVGTSQPSLLLQSRSELRHVLHVTNETTFEIQHTAGVLSVLTTALGAAASLAGLDEVYTEVTIIRL